jgi:hypothetical protein
MIATGCLVQWFEIDMIDEYINSLKTSIGINKDKVIIDFGIVINQQLEKFDTSQGNFENIIIKPFKVKMKTLIEEGYKIDFKFHSNLYTIADYRREFNQNYCNKADVLFWGESDMLVPSQAIETILSLNEAAKETTPKWIGFFATCKMWDDSWKILEHPKVTDLPRDPYAWYGTRSYMSYETMEEINSNVESGSIISSPQYKFNGCGLVISSEIVRSGVNIPESVFFTHEDTAFMNNMVVTFGNNKIPFYIIKNILLVHNREHPQKRNYVLGESGNDLTAKRKSNKWYNVASEYSKHNAYNFNKQIKSYNWDDVWNNIK